MNHKRSLILLLLTAIAFLTAIPAVAKADSPVEARFTIDDKELAVGDPIHITLSVTHPAGHQVIFPQIESNWGDFTVKYQSPATTVDNGDGTETTNQIMDVRVFAPGTFTTPPLSVTISDSEGQLSAIAASPVTFVISSVLIDGDNELRDIKPQAELPFFNIFPWILTLFVFVLFVGGTAYLKRRHTMKMRMAEIDNRFPHEVALDELDHIEGLKLPDAGRFKEHYTLTSDCLRSYMENTFHLPVMERTTGEIQANMKQINIPVDIAKNFISFLQDSDLIKFSKFKPDVTSSYELLENARQIVEETKPAITTISEHTPHNISIDPTNRGEMKNQMEAVT
ncbi:hypothetical protein ACFLUA_01045 [Chloroflexota bacterium]